MRRIGVLLALAMLVGACTPDSGDTTTTATTTTTAPASTTTTAATTTTLARDVVIRVPELGPFAPVEPVPLLLTGSPYPGPAHPASLDGVIRQPGTIRSEEAAAALVEHGFVVVPARRELFHQAYQSYEAEKVWYVTTDAAYHTWHLAFDKVLREVETGFLLPALEDLVSGLLDAARLQRSDLAGTDLADDADRVVQLFEAASVLLGLDVGPVGPLARAEVDLISEAIEKTASPITSFAPCIPGLSPANCVDYSLFLPRGHYTRSEDLERYFRAMSLLGQSSFFVGDPEDPAWDARSLRLGLLTTRLFGYDQDLTDRWTTVFEPTSFLVGAADDYTPFELAEAAEEVSPGIVADPTGVDVETMRAIARSMISARPVRIDPEAAAVRIMGARFVVDAYVLDQLVRPYVGTEEAPRWLASPLDLAAAMGSELAYEIQDRAGETAFENYDRQLDGMQAMVDARTEQDWTATVYDAWLAALEPKFVERADPYPPYMQSTAWAAKDLQTALGSYTELKHDTILYAKQSSAAEGDWTPLPEPARHWVEPDPVAFARLSAAAAMLQDGLEARSLLGEDQTRLLTDLRGMLDRLARIAFEELEGLPITDDDNQWLGRIGSLLESLWFQSADHDPEIGQPMPADMDAAVVSDIQSSPHDYLEIGTGWVDEILVLVPNDHGRFQVATGGVYSYYEFTRPRTELRLTDEEWRVMVQTGTEPPRPTWQDPFLVPRPAD